MKHLTLDDVIHITGQFGRSQKIYYFGISLLQFFIAPHMLLNVFTGLEPTFHCSPKDVIPKHGATLNRSDSLLNECIDNDVQKCRIIYTSQYKSFASEWNLICSEKYKVALVQSVWMFGVMTGALVLGGLADIIGRLRTLMLALLGTIAFEGFSAFAPTYTVMVVFRFLGGVCCSLIIVASFVLSQELVGMEWRSFCGMLLSMFFALGIAVFSALSAIVSDWRTLTLICSVMGIAFLVFPCYIPESPRWLASQGRNDEAKAVLEGMAMKNMTLDKLPKQWNLPSVVSNLSKKQPKGICLLFSHSYVALITLILIFSWFVNSATYYGLTMAASDLGGNVYVSTALNGLVEIPSGLVAMFMIDRLGRRITLCGFMLFGGVACLCIQLLPASLLTLTTLFALLGKLSISSSFAAIYIFSGEIFPTMIRNSGMGIMSVAARIGGMLAPFILMLGDVAPNLQFTALGLLTFSSGLLNLKLPETLGQPMPETIADILAFRKASKTVHHGKYNKLETEDVEADKDTLSRSPSPRRTTEEPAAADDLAPLIVENTESRWS